jgi:hypothetical protein
MHAPLLLSAAAVLEDISQKHQPYSFPMGSIRPFVGMT